LQNLRNDESRHASGDDLPYDQYESRNTRKRRRRQSSQQQQQLQSSADQSHPGNQQGQQQQQQQQQDSRQRQRSRRVLVGNVSSSMDGRGIGAAKKLVKKAVFCVDNVKPIYGVDDVRSFVSSLSVNVLSCFQAESRRRPNERGPVTDRRAFRLCIADSDRERLLDASKWPDSVTISEWYRIPPSVAAEKRRCAEATCRMDEDATVLAASGSNPVMSVMPAAQSLTVATETLQPPVDDLTAGAGMDNSSVVDSNDTTVLYNNGITTASS